ncbi:tetratricopeptide repeat protein [bacterium M00.F.Ca.ET.159.01.1.1]|nr:tetratricopeptide repeat protein [bacterium M00.F.Ca.ET.159.01.1.1]TGT82392.1 tetratricopeptide repeat protein [bacterium M00.F.Ca.ET.157.01.1.1]
MAIAYNDRGFAWSNKSNYDLAIADYDRAIELDAKSIKSYQNRAFAWVEKGQYDRAIADYGEAVQLDPKDARTYAGRGVLYLYSTGQLTKAQVDLAQAAALVPDNAYFAIWLDIATRRNGAASHLQQAETKLDMTKWPAPLVSMLLGRKTPAEALSDANAADLTQRTGKVCETNFYTAELDRLQGHDEDALRLYRLAVSDCPRNFVEYRAAKMALRALGTSP